MLKWLFSFFLHVYGYVYVCVRVSVCAYRCGKRGLSRLSLVRILQPVFVAVGASHSLREALAFSVTGDAPAAFLGAGGTPQPSSEQGGNFQLAVKQAVLCRLPWSKRYFPAFLEQTVLSSLP